MPQARNNGAPSPPGTATLRGHVFAADTGQPLRKAQVRIFANEIRENRMATTDAEGRYEFKEVRAGRYTDHREQGQLRRPRLRAAAADRCGRSRSQILDNQTVEKMDLSLPRGSVITGRILDEFGEPMSDVQIARAAVPDRPGTAPARADGTADVDRRHRRVPAVRHPARAVLPDGDVAHDQPDEQRGPDRVRADVLSRHRQPGAGAAPHGRASASRSATS